MQQNGHGQLPRADGRTFSIVEVVATWPTYSESAVEDLYCSFHSDPISVFFLFRIDARLLSSSPHESIRRYLPGTLFEIMCQTRWTPGQTKLQVFRAAPQEKSRIQTGLGQRAILSEIWISPGR